MSKVKFYILAFCLVAGVSAGAIWLVNAVMGSKPYSAVWKPERSRAELEAACRKEVREADTRAAQSIAQRSAELREFVNSRKPGVGSFSKDIVSWYGKWRAVKPYLPFTKSDGHKDYVMQKFNQHIFSDEDLSGAVRRTVDGSIKDLETIENELAIALRQEILGRSLEPDETPIAAEEFKKAVERMVAASQWDAAKAAGALVASEVGAQVATQVFVRLGVSAGILTAGAANSWWNLGAGLVVGVVVDAVWEWVDDPARDIEREMTAALDKLSTDAAKAVNDEMNKVILQRSDLWNKTLSEILP